MIKKIKNQTVILNDRGLGTINTIRDIWYIDIEKGCRQIGISINIDQLEIHNKSGTNWYFKLSFRLLDFVEFLSLAHRVLFTLVWKDTDNEDTN